MKPYRGLYLDQIQPNEILIKIRLDKDTFAELASVANHTQAKQAADKILLIHRTLEELTQLGAKALKDLPKMPVSMVPLQPHSRRGPVQGRKAVTPSNASRRKFSDTPPDDSNGEGNGHATATVVAKKAG